jgi:small conductance mechanosensitive channel
MDKALAELNKELNNWYISIIQNLPNFIVAILVMVSFLIIAAVMRRIMTKLLAKMTNSKAVNNLVSNSTYIFFIGLGFIVALGVMNLEGTVNKLLAGAGIVGLGLSFAFQDIIANVFAGAIIAVRRPFRVGDIVETNDIMGTVEDIRLRTVVIHNFYGQMIILPSRSILQNPIKNYTFLGKRRIELAVGISYGEDLERVKTITLDAVNKVKSLLPDRAVELFYTGFGDSSINFIARFWIEFNDQAQYLKAISDTVMSIKAAYNEHDITIPFPIRTLDFGIKGGEKFYEMFDSNGDNGKIRLGK